MKKVKGLKNPFGKKTPENKDNEDVFTAAKSEESEPKPDRSSLKSDRRGPKAGTAPSSQQRSTEPRQVHVSFSEEPTTGSTNSSRQKKDGRWSNAPPALPLPPTSVDATSVPGTGSSQGPSSAANSRASRPSLALALPPPPNNLPAADSRPSNPPPLPMRESVQMPPQQLQMQEHHKNRASMMTASGDDSDNESQVSEIYDPNADKRVSIAGARRSTRSLDDTGSDTMIDDQKPQADEYEDDFIDDGMAGAGCCTILGFCPREEVIVIESFAQLKFLRSKITNNQYDDAVLAENIDVGSGVVPAQSKLVSCLYADEQPDSTMWTKHSQDAADKARDATEEDFPMTLVFKLPEVVYGTEHKEVPRWAVAVRCPCCLVLMVPLITIGLLAATLPFIAGKTMEEIIEFDVSSFARADGNRSMTQAAMGDALNYRADPNEERRLTALLRYITFDNQIIYKARNGTIMLPERLDALRRFERDLRNLPGWRKICAMAKKRDEGLIDEEAAGSAAQAGDARRCEPGRSFLNFAYSEWIDHSPPAKAAWNAQTTAQSSAVRMNFTGHARNYLPIPTVLVMLRTLALLDLFVPITISDILSISATSTRSTVDSIELYSTSNAQTCQDFHEKCEEWALAGYCPLGEPQEEPGFADSMADLCRFSCGMCPGSNIHESMEALRSIFIFRVALTEDVDVKDIENQYKTFLDTEFYPMLSKPPEYITDEFINVYFAGYGIYQKQILEALFGDLVFGAIAMFFVWTYLLLHTRSPFLASMGIYLIFSSIPCGFAVFTYASDGGRVTIASFLSIFLIIGIGSDMLFIYTDFWKQTLEYTRDPVVRLQFTLRHAGKSTLATSFTTGMSFLANMASVLRGLREFGFFMGSCVAFAYILVLIGYPPVLILNERIYAFCKRRLKDSRHTQARMTVVTGDHGHEHYRPRKSLTVATEILQRTLVYSMNPMKQGVGSRLSKFVEKKVPDYLFHGRYVIPIAFCIWTIAANIWSASLAVIDTRIPDLFPQDHNQVAGINEIGKFQNFGVGLPLEKKEKGYGGHVGVPRTGLVCTSPFSKDEKCHLHQCFSTEYPHGNTTHCKCRWRPGPVCKASQIAGIEGQVITSQTMSNLSTSILKASLRQFVENEIKKVFPDAQELNDAPGWNEEMVTTLPLMQQNWESGRRSFAAMMRPPGFSVQLGPFLDPPPGDTCKMDYTCYCGGRACEDPGESHTEDLVIDDGSSRRLSPSEQRKLEEVHKKRFLPAAQQAEVSVLIGIKVVGEDKPLGVSNAPIWEFDPYFRPDDPRVLRSLLALCSSEQGDQKRMEHLQIVKSRCWLQDFKLWFEEKGHRFPPDPHVGQDFSELLTEFLAGVPLTGVRPSSDLLWMRDGKLVAMMIDYKLNISKRSGSDVTFYNMDLWDQFIEDFNTEVTPYAEAFHISDLWVQAEAAQSVVDSTIVTFMISCGCAFLGMTIFTANPPLALIAVVNIVGVICCLTWFMVVVMQWPIGPIEVLSLIIFVGFAVDYSLHISHQYGAAELDTMDSDTSTRYDDHYVPSYSTSGGNPTAKRRPSERFTIRFTDANAPYRGKDYRSMSMMSNSKTVKPNMGRFSIVKNDAPQIITRRQSDAIDRDPQAERFERVRFSLHRMTSATLGSAFTTAGSAAFLCFCTLQIFVKLGTVILIVTLLSILFALLPLPCCLIAFGPTDKGKRIVTEAITNVTDRVRHVRTHLDAASRRSSVAGGLGKSVSSRSSRLDDFVGFGGPSNWPKGLSWDTGEHEEPPRHFVLSTPEHHVANTGRKKPPEQAALDVAG
eukprot:gnl/MRDRNA2_/MRDRNA2_82855_c0_seq1.p1 gnl/MRDRNA2_/MRDRNA2_82855_c0~~gnl/MRDRNA2_/MRDRNA2_82855_c0_seq1.p1  ORF type:complete len:1787 (-),score=229.40 gnl/MRDRNA2_/MRDRNA2_82855_c0_seq1:71-5431(-)